MVAAVWGVCLKCGLRWGSLVLCHCSLCCTSYSDVEAFDCHRKWDKCVDPATVKMVQGPNKGKPRLRLTELRTVPEGAPVWKRTDFRDPSRWDILDRIGE